MSCIYLDNAATSFPKPEPVYAAVDSYQRNLGVAFGRGATRRGGDVQRVVEQCRLNAARLFGVACPEQVIFTSSGTDSLNMALRGLLQTGDRVLTTVWDHNSVLRPLRELQLQGEITVELIPDDGHGQLDLDALDRLLKVNSRLVAITHASNVTGIVQPVQEVARRAHAAGALVLLDAAQTAGHLPVSLLELDVDLIACPGHKGLLGPLGTGLLILAPELGKQLRPLRYGGTGTSSESDRQPESAPEKFEAGNQNVPGLFGLAAALEWRGNEMRESSEPQLIHALIQGLHQLPGVQVHCFEPGLPRVGLVSFSMSRMTPQVIAGILDEHFQIETRAGLHCAPQAHRALGTLASGGTVRLSLGPFTTPEEIDLTLEALAQIAVAA